MQLKPEPVIKSKAVAERTGQHISTVTKWALVHNVYYEGEGKRKTYYWTEAQIEEFKKRDKPGWKKGRKRKPL